MLIGIKLHSESRTHCKSLILHIFPCIDCINFLRSTLRPQDIWSVNELKRWWVGKLSTVRPFFVLFFRSPILLFLFQTSTELRYYLFFYPPLPPPKTVMDFRWFKMWENHSAEHYPFSASLFSNALASRQSKVRDVSKLQPTVMKKGYSRTQSEIDDWNGNAKEG